MKRKKKNIIVFEHERLRIGQSGDNSAFDERKLFALQQFYGTSGVPYFSLIHNGVQFNSFVGVLQVGNLIIEVLPKADKAETSNANEWRKRLIDMMRAVNNFEVKATSQSHLRIKPNTILDLYIEMFISQVEYLLRTGLVKQYRKETGNQSALKGNLLFHKNIQENLIHQERFYVHHGIYDNLHKLNSILYKTILLIKEINTNVPLISRINALLLNFPEQPKIKVTEQTFQRITYNRKTESYRKAIEIAKFLLLQYHPDLTSGNNHVLALMFDMNVLWEQFIYVSLKKHLQSEDVLVRSQLSKNFWQHERGATTKIRPDIVIKVNEEKNYVLDTKWKCLDGISPSTDDLRQMYVYHEYFNADKVALIYPRTETLSIITVTKGNYFSKKEKNLSEKECSIMPIFVEKDVKNWQKSIAQTFSNWIKYNNL